MRVLVTGGAGFIGSHAVDRLLAEGHAVLVVDDLSTGKRANVPDGAEFAQRDIADPALRQVAAAFAPDVVSHFAAQASVAVSMKEPQQDATTNIIGGLNVLQAAIEAGARQLIYITTGGALYGAPDYLPADEEHPIRPESPYGLSKWTLEQYLKLLAPATMPLKVLRLANIYGPRQDPHGEAGVVAIFAGRMARQEPVTIFGSGEQTRDFVYVGDVIDAHQAALAHPESITVNISTGQGTSVNEVFRVMAEATGYTQAPIYAPPRTGDILHSVLDSRRARRHLGWEPRTPLETGLRRTIASIAPGAEARS